ncbi:MAG: hypothetical protein AAGJ91_01565 [Pseudomonadota bacterium]
MATKIKAAVGRKGKNQPEDVKIVQELLNAVASPVGFAKLQVNGKPSQKLNEAIGAFQAAACTFTPDQTVEPNKNTIKALLGGPSKLKAAQKNKEKADEKRASDAAEAAKKKAVEAAKKAAEKQIKPVKKAAEAEGGFWSFLDDISKQVEDAAEQAVKIATETAKKNGKSIEKEIERLLMSVTRDAQKQAEEEAKKRAEEAKKKEEERKREEDKKKAEEAEKARKAKSLSGKAWFNANQAKFPNSNKISDLEGGFKAKVLEFQKALKAAGCTIRVASTLRNEKRAAIMHWSFKVAKGKVKPNAVPKIAGVDILFDHGEDKVSIAKAKEMVGPNGFRIRYQPSLTSMHISGQAIDWHISWSGDLKIKKKNGEEVTISSSPKNGTNSELHAVGKSYGVHKLVGDVPHWSVNGR